MPGFLQCRKPGLETEVLLDPARLHMQSPKAEDKDWLLLLHWKAAVLLCTWDILMFTSLKNLGCWHCLSPAWFWLSPANCLTTVTIKAIYSKKPDLAAGLNLIRATVTAKPSVFRNENSPCFRDCLSHCRCCKKCSFARGSWEALWISIPKPIRLLLWKNKIPLVHAVFLEFGTL